MKSLWKMLKDSFLKISLVDRFLILFMLILLVYTAINLFTATAASSQDSNTVNIIVRTSTSAIFGYFVSSNFVKAGSSRSTKTLGVPSKAVTESTENQLKNQIGFQMPASTTKVEKGDVSFNEFSCSTTENRNKTQIIIIAVIGISSLALLFITRDFVDITPEMAATTSQLRDFVSACIGFLVSCKNAQ